MIAQGLPIAAALFLLFPRLASPLWGLPADHARGDGTVRPDGARARSASCRCPTPSRFASTSTARRRRRAQRYWRGPVLSLFNGREWRRCRRTPGGRLAARDAGRRRATRSRSSPTTSRGCSRSTSRRRCRRSTRDAGTTRRAPAASRGYSREQQLLMRAPVTQPLRYSQLSALRDRYPARSTRDGADQPRGCRARQSAHRSSSRASLRAAIPTTAAYIRAVLRGSTTSSSSTRSRRRCSSDDPVDMFLFDTRRGFCEHYASAFVVLLRAAGIPARVVTGYQGGEINPRGGYMIVRQSDAHAWAEAIVDGQWQRFDPTAAVAPSRIERGLCGAAAASEPVPLLRAPGRRLAQGRAARRRRDQPRMAPQRRSGSIATASARCGATGSSTSSRRGRSRLARRRRCSHGRAACSRWFAARRKRQERALALWDDVCRRLARAGLPRLPLRRPARVRRRARRHAGRNSTIAFRAIGESFAALRYGDAIGATASGSRWSQRWSARSTCCRRPATLRAM